MPSWWWSNNKPQAEKQAKNEDEQDEMCNMNDLYINNNNQK